MPRNFFRRVEVMFPVEAADLKHRILHEIVPAYLTDNVKARILQADGGHTCLRPRDGEPAHRCQQELLQIHSAAPTLARTEPLNGYALPRGAPARAAS
jgi:polyphosphate kinase